MATTLTSRASTTFSKRPSRTAATVAAISAAHSVWGRGDTSEKLSGGVYSGSSARRSRDSKRAENGPTVVIHRRPVTSRPTVTAGMVRAATAPRSKGKAERTTGPQPGRPTWSSVAMACRVSRTESEAVGSSSPVGSTKRSATPRAARANASRCHNKALQDPPTASRSRSAPGAPSGRATVRATRPAAASGPCRAGTMSGAVVSTAEVTAGLPAQVRTQRAGPSSRRPRSRPGFRRVWPCTAA